MNDGPFLPGTLEALLDQLADGARDVVGDRLVGLYLVGSFALGAGDEHSDVDFIAAVTDDPTDEDIRALERIGQRQPVDEDVQVWSMLRP